MAATELDLAQHGRALPRATEPERPLLEEGREEVQRVALAAVTPGVRVGKEAWRAARILAPGMARP